MFSLLPVLALALSSLVAAAPVQVRKTLPRQPAAPKAPQRTPPHLSGGGSSFLGGQFPGFGNCSVSSAAINFPSGQTNLTIPSGQQVETIMVGRGTQNYTCNSTTSTFVSAGARADLFDVSCLYTTLPSSAFFQLPQMALQLPNPPTGSASSSNVVAQHIASLGNIAAGSHYFITEPTGSTPTGLQPKFDFTTTDPADATKYVTASKTATLNAPNSPTTNVAWLQLTAIANQGSLASSVYRVDTAGGQPATSCAAGDTSEVDYAALYFFLK